MVKQEREIQVATSSSTTTTSSSLTLHHQSCKNKKYKGVRMRTWGSWVSEIRVPNQKTRIWLGSYSTAEAAARAYDAALLCLKGPKANLNFPNITTTSPFLIDIDEKIPLSPKSIQKIAAQAANSIDPFVPNADHDHEADIHHHPSPSSSYSSAGSSQLDDHHNDDDDLASLMGSFVDEHVSLIDPSWYDDHNEMFSMNGASFDYSPQFISSKTTMDDFYDDADIQLWSFT